MPADDTRGLMSDKYDGMASKAAAHSTLNPKAPYCVSTNRRLLCTVVERVRDCWIRRKGQYVDGEELTAADVDHLEAMVDFINQEEPDVTVDESLEDFISCSGRLLSQLYLKIVLDFQCQIGGEWSLTCSYLDPALLLVCL
ncbi:hypothetical protein O6H91_10G029100 [Diphasiastrum complanatum]|uniref:Uncharacterized protein n=1 Tax=Diphasiastrum complanatum TaxID=34168 RepID=A0ACC2CFH7_DIPCM|nr:hypothetical protein O6H91_Y306500 [Diphasiastrum complanatum]KAJ7540751.1 hypothetical protein O6H91_10G029100 [Diphasiastrum complanatum]